LEDASPSLVVLAFVRCPRSGLSCGLYETGGLVFENKPGDWGFLLLCLLAWAVLFSDDGGDGDGDGDVGEVAEIRMQAIMLRPSRNSPSMVAVAFLRCPGSGLSSGLFGTCGPGFENESGDWEPFLFFLPARAARFSFDGDASGCRLLDATDGVREEGVAPAALVHWPVLLLGVALQPLSCFDSQLEPWNGFSGIPCEDFLGNPQPKA